MAQPSLVAHSLAETYLFLMVRTCCACGRGPLRGDDAKRISAEGRELVLSMAVRCEACSATEELRFQLPFGTGVTPDGAPACVNPTQHCSRIIDVAQWITLFRTITEAASRETDKAQARHLGLEAAQCLEEALKFYDDEANDLPGPDAFFHDSSRERFRAVPESFSRQRLLHLRSKLPSTEVMRQALSPTLKPKKKSWWKRI